MHEILEPSRPFRCNCRSLGFCIISLQAYTEFAMLQVNSRLGFGWKLAVK